MIRSGLIVYLWLSLLGLSQSRLSAQEIDTAILIDELSISARTLLGTGADTIDLSHAANRLTTLTHLLRTESNIYFRDFGPGSSSTVSMFGSKSNEVALIWNGVQVANPMLGVNDYSMISMADLTSLRIARIGNSTIYGAGSGAGAILLDQKISSDTDPVTLSAGWSSLNEIKATGSYTNSEGRWKSRTTVNAAKAQNNFQYKTLRGENERLPHARSGHLNLSHHSEFHHNDNQYWTLSAWGRKHTRDIPPTLTEPRSEAEQSDEFARSVIQFHLLKPRHHLNVKAYYGYQSQHYQNELINLKANHRFQNAQIRIDNQWQPHPEVFVKYGLQNNYFSSRSDNYQGQKHQNRISPYAHLQYELSRIPLELIMMAKPEWVSGQRIGWTTEAKLRYSHAQTGQWMIFANQNMVWPTLNDLYWNPGGNPDLIPEHNRVMGLSWKKTWPDNLLGSATFYYRRANNWIQWLPGNLGFWRPVNAHKGRSYGANLELKKDFGVHLEMKAGYQFVRTYIKDKTNRQDQTIYSPKHMWSVLGIYKINKQWEWQLDGQFTSTRYVTKDHTEALDPYFLCHTSLFYTMKDIPWTFGVQLTNLFDAEYQGIKNRPMPGRQIQLNTLIKF